MLRVLHFSDVHVGASFRGVPLRKWLGKRAVGGLNLWARRRHDFAEAIPKLGLLDRFRREQAVDLVICTGDYTALGLPNEFAAARRAVAPLMQAPAGFVHVPGNHDLYMPDVVRERTFENTFAGTLHSDLPQFQLDGPWPLVRRIGDDLAVVAVNSARPNPQPWRSNGRIPDRQLAALRELLAHDSLASRYLFIITHYAPRLASGAADSRSHGMLNADEFLDVCAGVARGAILCGHVHHGFRVRIPQVSPTIFCAGSATLAGREHAWLFDIDGARTNAAAVRLDGSGYRVDG